MDKKNRVIQIKYAYKREKINEEIYINIFFCGSREVAIRNADANIGVRLFNSLKDC